jgi:aspartate beta-hydroxylase
VLTIDGRDHRIGDGESLLWDDTYRHEVLNDSAEMRAALLLDVRRRGMPLDMELLSRVVIGLVRASVLLRR